MKMFVHAPISLLTSNNCFRLIFGIIYHDPQITFYCKSSYVKCFNIQHKIPIHVNYLLARMIWQCVINNGDASRCIVFDHESLCISRDSTYTYHYYV